MAAATIERTMRMLLTLDTMHTPRAAGALNAQGLAYHCAVPAPAGAQLATAIPTAEHAGSVVTPATELQKRVTGVPQPVRDTTGRQGGANSPPIKVTPT